ncbi:MAG TPA: succinylglutamate desuccinylase/aspartoacylase family protein [Candidatus Limnocylindria bacterium]|nr:succinylglutamate desuccinylase/aspartoacylase family protein [Candidatus Limnocylindria bacterium]
MIPGERVIGRRRGSDAGPLLVVMAGMHGNEPAGVVAAQRVLDRLAAGNLPRRGDVLALRGNRPALAANRRFIDRDLNRGWIAEQLTRLRSEPRPDREAVEDGEQREIAEVLESAFAASRGPAALVDLHTTSAEGIPFSLVGRRETDLTLARRLPLTVVTGLQGRIRGVLSDHAAELGYAALAVEGGQNESAESVRHLEGMFWLLLEALGILAAAEVPDRNGWHECLALARRGLPPHVHVLHRHALAPGDGFRMEPGFTNIQGVHAGQLLARDASGEIRAAEDGVLLMPLYQQQGDDGFFFGREESAS